MTWWFPVVLGALGACGTLISPQQLEQAELPAVQKEELGQRWDRAVELANGFLDSAANRALQDCHYQLQPQGMVLTTPQGPVPVQIRCTPWGSLVVWSGFEAQERSWGFVVGARGDGPAVAANSFFLRSDGQARPAWMMAELILHETTHQLHHVGTVSWLRGAVYYIQALSYGGGREHPQEALPYQVSADFMNWHFQPNH